MNCWIVARSPLLIAASHAPNWRPAGVSGTWAAIGRAHNAATATATNISTRRGGTRSLMAGHPVAGPVRWMPVDARIVTPTAATQDDNTTDTMREPFWPAPSFVRNAHAALWPSLLPHRRRHRGA